MKTFLSLLLLLGLAATSLHAEPGPKFGLFVTLDEAPANDDDEGALPENDQGDTQGEDQEEGRNEDRDDGRNDVGADLEVGNDVAGDAPR